MTVIERARVHGTDCKPRLELGLIDEIDLHVLPILLGEGIRLYDKPGAEPVRLHRVGDGDPTSALNVRYQPTTEGAARP